MVLRLRNGVGERDEAKGRQEIREMAAAAKAQAVSGLWRFRLASASQRCSARPSSGAGVFVALGIQPVWARLRLGPAPRHSSFRSAAAAGRVNARTRVQSTQSQALALSFPQATPDRFPQTRARLAGSPPFSLASCRPLAFSTTAPSAFYLPGIPHKDFFKKIIFGTHIHTQNLCIQIIFFQFKEYETWEEKACVQSTILIDHYTISLLYHSETMTIYQDPLVLQLGWDNIRSPESRMSLL